MAAGLTKTDTMMSVREMPWHGLGRVLEDYPGSIGDALTMSGLNWDVIQKPVSIPVTTEVAGQEITTHQTIPNTVANVREDTDDVLGIVTGKYKIIQNIEAFDFLDSLVGGDVMWETAGSLYGGRTIWILLRLPNYIEVGGDQIAQYIFLQNSHDGKGSAMSSATPVRIVCANTLGWAIGQALRSNAQRVYRIHHTGNIAEKINEARKVMGVTINYYEKFRLLGDRLATERITLRSFTNKVINPLLPIEEGMGDRAVQNAEIARQAIVDIFKGKGVAGDTSGNAPGTKWCAANAITEYADFSRRITSRGSQVARSFDDVALKQRGFDLVMAA